MRFFLLAFIPLTTLTVMAQQSQSTDVPSIRSHLCIDVKATLGEGALYCTHDSCLYWVDIEEGILYQCRLPVQHCRRFKLPGRIGTVVRDKNHHAILAMETGIYSLDLHTEELCLICSPAENQTGIRFNDGKCSPAGSLWAGTMSTTGKRKSGALYRISPDGKFTKMIDSVSISNGIIWSPDGTKMYYVDTPTSAVVEYDYNTKADTITNPRIVIRIPHEMGYPDGMTIDRDGNLWIAHWGGSGVYCWNPETGKLLVRVEIPAKNVTSCAFGGTNLDTLFITTARTGNSEETLKNYPHSGSLFIAFPDTRGIPSYSFSKPEQ